MDLFLNSNSIMKKPPRLLSETNQQFIHFGNSNATPFTPSAEFVDFLFGEALPCYQSPYTCYTISVCSQRTDELLTLIELLINNNRNR